MVPEPSQIQTEAVTLCEQKIIMGMKTTQLLDEIQKLPVAERLYLIERSMQWMRRQEEAKQMKIAAEQLYADYVSDAELTAFSGI